MDRCIGARAGSNATTINTRKHKGWIHISSYTKPRLSAEYQDEVRQDVMSFDAHIDVRLRPRSAALEPARIFNVPNPTDQPQRFSFRRQQQVSTSKS